ncbi:hypothetical protein [Cyclobacterium xiamenense]|uniref:hypothetical protein n=1 Tax=Cyclobacterium xiamenense TaxID=1297121 RepID=UPI0035CFC932
MRQSPIFLIPVFFATGFLSFNAVAQEKQPYTNRIEINVLGLPSENLVLGYEHSFKDRGIWLGLEHRLNPLSEDKDQQANSLALEYRYYFSAKAGLASGIFAGFYAKYRWGEEATNSSNPVEHRYRVFFSGLNAGYRYTYNRLALSGFLGYGLPLASTEATEPPGAVHALNENYKNDFRIGMTVGLAF